MFFNKFANKNTAPQKTTVLGTSALGLYLAAELQKVGHKVNILCAPQAADEYNATDFIFKDSHRLQNSRQNFHCDFEQTFAPQVLFIASEQHLQRSDLLLLSPAKLTDSIIVNLVPCKPSGFISEMLKHQVTDAYFSGWLNKEKNHIYDLSDNNQITFSADETAPIALLLREIFTSTPIKISARNDDAANFWKWAAPRAYAALITLSAGKSPHVYAKNPDNRQSIDQYVAEISALAAMDNAGFDKSAAITDILNIPDNITLETEHTAITLLRIERLDNLLFHSVAADDQRFPLIRDLLRQIRNKYGITA